MVHVPAKFQENTSMRFWVTVRKLNVTDGQTDGGRYLPGVISRPGPSAPLEITKVPNEHYKADKALWTFAINWQIQVI